jgi:hypothetical protein
LEDLTYIAPGKRQPHVARAGLDTDLATVPHSLWSVIAPFGQQSLPSIIHDQECHDAKEMVPQRSPAARRARVAIDARFREGLLERGVPRFRAALLWSGVSIGRWWDHSNRVLRLLMILQLFLGYVAIVWGACHLGSWEGWAAMGAPALMTVVWDGTCSALLIAQYPGLPLVAIGLANFGASLAEWLPNVILGARRYPPSPEQLEVEAEANRARQTPRAPSEAKRPFRGVGLPPGLKILPR